jgi:hypothetical protein
LRGRLPGFAAQLVQYASEITKPNGERLVPYQDANIASTKFRLFSPAPVYDDLEELQLADGLRQSLAELGADDPFVKTVLGDKTPEDVAKELVSGTKLANPEVRKSLFEGGEAAVTASNDPMVVLARKLAPMTQETRAAMERNVTAITASAGAAIGKARFGVYGRTTNPDATFTLRLSYGAVKGYPMNGTAAPAKTTMYGLYDRALSFNNAGPFELPKRFLEGRDKLELATPLNFVSSCDIIGGNSGSPVVDRQGQFVGLIFDGNIESLPGRFLYSELKNRAVAVHPAAIIECLRKLYDAGSLADELEGVAKKAELQAPQVSPKAAPGK